MPNFFKGTILLSTFLALYLILGPMSIAVRGELIEQPDSIFKKPYIEILVPSSIFIYITTLYVLYSIRFVELPIGTLKTLLIIGISLFFDFGSRILVSKHLDTRIRSTGPFAIVTSLLCLYCILYPTYKSTIVPINDKLAMFIVVLVSGLFDDLLAVVPVICGILSFILISPVIIPIEKDKNI